MNFYVTVKILRNFRVDIDIKVDWNVEQFYFDGTSFNVVCLN